MTLAGAALARRLPSWSLPLALGIVVALAPTLGISPSTQRQVILTAILALLVSGLNLSLGYAGELSLGGPAVYAVGAYVSGYLGTHGHTDILVQLVASSLVALAVGLLTGIPGLRLGNWSLAMTSFFLVLLVPDLIAIFSRQTGGRVGLAGIGLPTIFGAHFTARGYYLLVVLVAMMWITFLRNLVTSRHGIAFRVLRQSPVLAASEGISVFRLKLSAYAIGAVPAGLAGTLFANLDHYISPAAFDFSLAVTILAASILGGSTSVYGAVVGAAIMQFGPMESTSFQKYALVAYGAFLVIGGVLLAQGLSGIANRLWVARAKLLRYGRGVASPAAGPQQLPDSDVELQTLPGAAVAVTEIAKSFSGLRALDGVSLTADAGSITALIGPNGSGKTTLLNVISGYYRSDYGAISVAGQVRAHRRPHQVARDGVSRTFQTPIIPGAMTVAEVVASGRFAGDQCSMISAVLRLPAYRRSVERDRSEVRRVLKIAGIASLANAEAASLPLGTRRMLEVARALISQPRVLLLDEAASGLDEHEIESLARLIRRIRELGGTVILVEHNFQLVLSLADQIYVLARGRQIAAGTPEEIAHDPAVLREYLGSAADGENPQAPVSDLIELRLGTT
jgi:branched-chain amino acid transport system permease protein